jgi:hypothetical protein
LGKYSRRTAAFSQRAPNIALGKRVDAVRPVYSSKRRGAHGIVLFPSRDIAAHGRLRGSGRSHHPTERGWHVQTDIQSVRDLITGAGLSPIVQQALLARFDSLPKLYVELGRTYESRFADQIVASVQRMVHLLSTADAGDAAPALAVTLVERLRAMHNQHGIAVVLKPPPAVKATRKKASGRHADAPATKYAAQGASRAGKGK